ncbi:hypothetical protein U9M48_007716 [Paspalum notatum var. saurae]|uniref:Uncharacterized protein n=1 Tax=Paspalum notatum var. saurae TaxID=547442 RepID=A0AAQ3SMR9_PASNO
MAAASASEEESRNNTGCRVIAQGYRVVDEQRHAVDYRPSVWGDYFIKNPALPHTHQQTVMANGLFYDNEHIDLARSKYLSLWLSSSSLPTEVTGVDGKETRCANQRSNEEADGRARRAMTEMKLIDALQRLGISYHFQDEIHASLQKLNSMVFNKENVHEISLQFWLLRQQRYNVSNKYGLIKNKSIIFPDVFQSFMDNQGNLNASLHGDVRTLLVLYEAAHLGTPSEQVLIEAQRQTTILLKSMVNHLEKPLADQVRHALQTPSFRRMKRLEARLYIPLYEQDKQECDELVLELAKLDFYLLQRIHRGEVKEICEQVNHGEVIKKSITWYHSLEAPRKLYYARHRPTEAYFWSLGVYYEPQYAKARMLLAKFIATITPYDDTFDNYGIWEELLPFSDVRQRWDMKKVGKLKECYNDFACFMFGTMIEIEKALPNDTARRNVDAIRDIDATEEILKWILKFPQIVKDSCIVSRLMDDIVAHEFETERNNVATAVTCYMKEYKTTKEDASESKVNVPWKLGSWFNLTKPHDNLHIGPLGYMLPTYQL